MALNVTAGSWRYNVAGTQKITLKSTDLGLPPTHRGSHVWATITELMSSTDTDVPFIGAAPMSVGAIAPRDGSLIDVQVHVNWDTPLRTRLTVFVAD